MADSFTQVYLQLVFSTYRRQPFIGQEWLGELHKYISGILKNQQQVPIRINSMPDHIHILFGMKTQRSMSEVIREVKADSTN
jgi:REP element-mobilizing transposase RayT